MNSIKVTNFKSIHDSGTFELRPLTVLAGINSSGKSSLLQALLLLKQTMAAGTTDRLKITGPYVVANLASDLVRNKKKGGAIGITLTISAKDLENGKEYAVFAPEPDLRMKELEVQVAISVNGKTELKSLECNIRYYDSDKEAYIKVKRNSKQDNLFTIRFTSPLMVGLDDSEKIRKMDDCTLDFHSFIPVFAEWKRQDRQETRTLAIMKIVERDLYIHLKSHCYLGPQRVRPELARSYDSIGFENVGIDGENTRFIYEQNKNVQMPGYGKGETLQVLCNNWICQKMGLARSMDVQRDANKLFRTIITNNDGLAVDLCQMGFGLSQILPIVVQGLMLYEDWTLIVEDPDVHMHPKVQALLVDFFIDLVKHGRRVIIETHSDHIVTRLRRRIADGTISTGDVNLSFVENSEEGSHYRFIDMEKDGSFVNELPEGFLDVLENDFMAIIAQR